MKNFNQFIKEASLRGNPGVPADKLSDMDTQAQSRLGVRKDSRPPMGLINDIMRLTSKSSSMISDKKEELEELATDIIKDLYGSIMDDVDLDIKFAESGMDVKNFMDENGDDEGDDEGDERDGISMREIDDEDTISEIHKRKIINNITQGEAKNTKRILVMPEIRDRIISIFGEVEGSDLIKTWVDITDIADKLDWIIPIEHKGDMMEQSPQGLAGACSVDWDVPEDIELDIDDLLDSDLSELNEEDNEDLSDALSSGNPTIKAIGIDFPMLLHEAIKGIYELIAAAGIPEDEGVARKVIDNTSSFHDEAEEFRYGPELASALRNFINKCSGVDGHPNMREMVFGQMVNMDADDFLDLFKRILIDDDSAVSEIEDFIEMINDDMSDYDNDMSDYNRDDTDVNYGSYDDDDDIIGEIETDVEVEVDNTEDLSSLPKFKLRELMDDALDNGDFGRAREIGKYLK